MDNGAIPFVLLVTLSTVAIYGVAIVALFAVAAFVVVGVPFALWQYLQQRRDNARHPIDESRPSIEELEDLFSNSPPSRDTVAPTAGPTPRRDTRN